MNMGVNSDGKGITYLAFYTLNNEWHYLDWASCGSSFLPLLLRSSSGELNRFVCFSAIILSIQRPCLANDHLVINDSG